MGLFNFLKGTKETDVNSINKSDEDIYNQMNRDIKESRCGFEKPEESSEEVLSKMDRVRETLSKERICYYDSDPYIAGKSLRDWNADWVRAGNLKTADLSPYSSYAGIFRYCLCGNIMYVGYAVHLDDESLKRSLFDYINSIDSESDGSGDIIDESYDEIIIDILAVGKDDEAVQTAKKLKRQFIMKFNPPWNKQFKI